MLPSRRFHFADTFPLLCGHQILPDVGAGCLTSSKPVQFTVALKGRLRHLLFRKIRFVIIYIYIRLSAVFRNLLNGFYRFGKIIRLSTAALWKSVAKQKNNTDQDQRGNTDLCLCPPVSPGSSSPFRSLILTPVFDFSML